MKWEGGVVLVFEIFEKREGSDFFHKKGRSGKIEGGVSILKKGVSLIVILTSPFTPFLLVLFAFHRKNLILQASNQQMWL